MLSITGVSWRTYLGTCIAAHSVSARESSATTTVVCCTLIDICIITMQLRKTSIEKRIRLCIKHVAVITTLRWRTANGNSHVQNWTNYVNKMAVQKLPCCLTSTMLSVSFVSFGTTGGTCVAAHSVDAAVSSTTTTVVCFTLVDIYVNTSKTGPCIQKTFIWLTMYKFILSSVYPGLHHQADAH